MTGPRQPHVAAIVYLDVEDEITSAAARIRGTREGRLAPAPATPRPVRPAPPLVRPRSSITDTLVMPLPEVAEERRRRRISGWTPALATALIVLVLAAGASAWILLPTATITVAARAE